MDSRAADDVGTPEAQADSSWEQLPAEQCSAATADVDVYVDDLISIFQGGSTERRQMLQHLFNNIDRLFRPDSGF